jgi:Protein of unknown function (DUF3159)
VAEEKKPAATPAAKTVAKPAATPVAKTVAKPAAKTATSTAAKPVVKTAAKTPAKAAATPATKAAPKTPATSATKAAASTAPKQATTTAAKPPVKPVVKAAAKPPAKPATKPAAKAVKPATAKAETEAPPTFSESLAAAAKQSGLSQLKPGETPNARALLGAIGGVRGIVESIVPGIAFLAIYLTTHNLLIAVLAPAFIALVFVVVRAGARSSMSSAVTGAVLLAITAVLTLITGRAVNNFVPGILINAAGFIVLLVSILVRWPLVGLVVGLLFGDVDGWRKDAAKLRILTIATWFWVGLFAIRLVIEVPLYFADNVTALGVVRLITSVPLYALCLWATWLLVRGVYAGESAAENDATETD